MAALVGLVRRNWQISNPPVLPKSADPLKFGILGAADIGPRALIMPAKTHPDVVVYAVAARSQEKAKVYAEKHNIPEVKATYQDLLDDPQITCIYIPLPNGLHYEWAIRALKAGKHVLLEKPSVSNAIEATALFRHPLLAATDAPVLMEAAHSFFHPAWTAFMSHITPAEVARAKATLWVPRWQFDDDDIRYKFDLAGGALMDLGAYTAAALWRVFGAEPTACEECKTVPGTKDPRCDRLFEAKYLFPGGGYGEMEGNLRAPLDRWSPNVQVCHRAVVLGAGEAGSGVKVGQGEEVARTRTVKLGNFVMPSYMHSIEVDDEFVLRKVGGAVLKEWKASRTVKVYSFQEIGINQPGEPYWTTWRYQLEQFVEKVRGRQPKQWVGAEDSIKTMRMIDMAYETAKLPLRPTSEYK